MNRELPTLYEESLEITLTVPFITFLELSFSGKMEDSKLSGMKEQLEELELGVRQTQVKHYRVETFSTRSHVTETFVFLAAV